MALLPPLNQYYLITFEFGSGGSAFSVAVNMAVDGAYSGDGSEFAGVLPAQGRAALHAVAQALGDAMSAQGGPSWGPATVTGIQAQPKQAVTLEP